MKTCGNCGNSVWQEPEAFFPQVCMECRYDGDAGRQEPSNWAPKNNAERIRAMSDEELARWLAEHQFLVAQETCEILGVKLSEDEETIQGSADENLKWLRQPVKEEI